MRLVSSAPTSTLTQSTDNFGIMKDINHEAISLEVVGVGIPLLPRCDLMSPPGITKVSPIKGERLSQIMEELDDCPIPLDWEL